MGNPFEKWNPSMAQVLLFAAGGGLVFVGEEFGVPLATDIGIIVLGVLMTVVGGDIALKRVGVFRTEAWGAGHLVEAYRAAADILWAIVFVVGGLAAAAVILVKWLMPSTPDTFWLDMLGNTMVIGVFLGFAGLMILLDGLIRAIVGSGRVNPSRFGGLAGAFDRAVGAATFVVGLAMAALGVVLVARPGLITTALDQLKNRLGGS